MGKTIINESIFSEITELYNEKGKRAAYELIRTKYGLKNPYNTLMRIKRSCRYLYNPETDRFISTDAESSAEAVFMKMDELCRLETGANHPALQEKGKALNRTAEMEKLIGELVSDRLLLLSKYVLLDTSARRILIDQSSLQQDGYQIETH